MTPADKREQDEWEELVNYPSAQTVSGPMHKYKEKTDSSLVGGGWKGTRV